MAHYGKSHCCRLPVRFLSAATTQVDQTVVDAGCIKMLVHAFISSGLNYCNQLFVGVSGQLLDKLQSIHNTAARLVTGARKFDRVTPVTRQLHWLPVRQRLQFKTAVLVFKCIHGQAPVYLSEY